MCSENVELNSFVFNTILGTIKQLLHYRRAANPDFYIARIGLFESVEGSFKGSLIHSLANHRRHLHKPSFSTFPHKADPSDMMEKILHVVLFAKLCEEVDHLKTDSLVLRLK